MLSPSLAHSDRESLEYNSAPLSVLGSCSRVSAVALLVRMCHLSNPQNAVLQVSDSYVGLDQTFWLDTYAMKEAAQPKDSNRDAGEDVKDGSKAVHRKGRNNPKGQGTGE